MIKFLSTFLTLLLLTSNTYAKTQTLTLNLSEIPEQIIQKAKPTSEEILKVDFDVTKVVAFVREWKDAESRKQELINLYSNVIPKVFTKHPKLKEFQLATYISTKSKTKYISKIIVTKDNLAKLDWNKIKKNKDLQDFKLVDFSEI